MKSRYENLEVQTQLHKQLLALSKVKAEQWPQDLSWSLPVLQSHRGFWSTNVCENTIEAFLSSSRRGYSMCELDVRWTLDKHVVLFHDSRAMTPEGLRPVESLSLKDLRLFYRQEMSIPTLQEVLDHPELQKMLWNIELKSNSTWDFTFETLVLRAIHQSDKNKQVLFSSFNPLSLWFLQKVAQNIPRAWLVSFEKHPQNPIYLRSLLPLIFLRIHALNIDHRFLSEEVFFDLQRKNIPVALWTVNSVDLAKQWLNRGVSSIITDTIEPF